MLPAPEYNLPQAAADALIASRKRRVDARQWDYPGLGGAATIPLLSDGNRVESPHLHLYREGYGAKWAFPVPGDRFRDVGDRWQTLEDFMDYCNIVDPPFIRWSQVT